MKKLFYAILACSLAFFAACDNEELNQLLNGGGTDQVKISLDRESAELTVGETLQLAVTVEPQLPAGPRVIWSSSDPDVATVTTGDEVAMDGTYLPAGLVTAVGEGEATITASIEGKEATCKITVKKSGNGDDKVEATSITLNKTELTLTTGLSEQLEITKILPENVTEKNALWVSSNTNVALVIERDDVASDGTPYKGGLVTGRDPGEAIITAYLGSAKAECKVTVVSGGGEETIESIVIEPAPVTLAIDEEQKLTAVIQPSGAKVTVEWKCDKPEVLAVGAISDIEAKVQGLAEGVATVTACAGGKSATCEVTVTGGSGPGGGEIEEGVEEVDLGLPSGIKWRGWNLGATKPEEYGDYFAWGETAPKAEYWRKDYKWWDAGLQALTKYVDDKTASDEGGNHVADNIMKLELEDDAANVILGNGWRIPTKADVEELCANCSWDLVKVNGVKGFIFTSNINGKSIFLPGAGYKFNNGFKLSDNDFGNYWINEVNQGGTYYAWYFRFEKSAFNGLLTAGPDGQAREHGLTIRPVKGDNNETPAFSLSETEINLEVGTSKQITATDVPANTTVYWNTSDSYTASVSKGLITGVGVGEAVITATAGGKQVQCKVHVLEPTSEEVVDLGLSVKWRGWNLGATKPSEYGDYYAWGEVETYYNGLEYGQTWGVNVTTWKDGKSNGYNMVSYKFRKSGSLAYGTGDDHLIVTKYNTHEGNGVVDNKTVLDPEDDAAHVILGNGWRMPTKAEWQELLDNCDIVYLKRIGWMFKTETNPGLGVAAIKFTSKKNGKSIVFPLAGNIFNVDPRDCSTYGYYWSSTLVESFISDGNEWAPAEASMCYLHSATDYSVNHGYRSKGYSIRPVMD